MISLFILLVLAWSFYDGYSRGLLVQSYYLVASVFALVLATGSHRSLAALLYLWVPFANATQDGMTYYFDAAHLFQLDKVFYAGLAFLLIYLLVYGIMWFLGIFMHLLQGYSPDTRGANLISGGLAVLVSLLSLHIVLMVLSTIPLSLVQERLHSSWLADGLLRYMPFLTSFLKQLWLQAIG